MGTHPDNKSNTTPHNVDSDLSWTSQTPDPRLPVGANVGTAEQSTPAPAQDSTPALVFLVFACSYLFWFATRSGSYCAKVGPVWLGLRALALSLPLSSSLIVMDLLYDALFLHHEHRPDPHSGASCCRLARRNKWRKLLFVCIAGGKMGVVLTYLLGLNRLFATCQ